MNTNRRRANLRMDQLRRCLRADPRSPYAARWRSYLAMDRDPRPLQPLGALSWIVRTNLRGRDGSHPTDAYVRDHMRRTLAAVRNHQPIPAL